MDNSQAKIISRRKESATYAVIIILLSIAVYVYTFNPKLGYLSDCARYYLVGQSVAAGAGFTQIWDVTQQPDGLSSPLYPLLIAIFSLTLTGSILFIKSINGLFLLGSVAIFFYYYKMMKFNSRLAFIILIPFLFNYWVLRHSSIMLTEIPFVFLTGMSFIFLSRSKDDKNLKDLNWWRALLFAVAAYYMRSIGIALVAALLMEELLRKRWDRAAVSALFFSITILPWIIRGLNLSGQTHFKIISSQNPLSRGGEMVGFIEMIDRIGMNFISYISINIPASMIPTFQEFYGSGSMIGWLTGLLLISGIVYGFTKLKFQKMIIGLYLLFYLMILLIFPSVYTGQRFLLPLLPLFYPLLFIGIRSVTVNYKLSSKIPIGFMILLGIINLFSIQTLKTETSKPLLHQWRGFIETAKWANENLPADAIVAVRLGEEFYLHSLRRTLIYPFIDDPDEFKAYLAFPKATHIVSDDLDYPLTDMRVRTMPFLKQVKDEYPELFKEVYRSKGGETLLFEIL